jgi:class 3 adenylate cyclase
VNLAARLTELASRGQIITSSGPSSASTRSIAWTAAASIPSR